MPLNFRSASCLTAGSSTAATRQAGARALWPSGREHSPHSVCWRAPAVTVQSPQLSRAGVITAWGAPSPEPAPNLLTEEAEGPSARTCWSLCSHSAGCWVSSFPWQDLPRSTQASHQSGLSRTTGNCEPRQKSLSGHFSLKRNLFFFFFLKEHQVKIGAVLSCVLSTFQWAKVVVSISPSHTDIPRKADESRMYSGTTCVLPLTNQLSHPLEVTNQSRWVHPSSPKNHF